MRIQSKSDTNVIAGDGKPLFKVGVSVLITRGDRVLMGVRKNNTAAGFLSTPGGRIEMDEDVSACAVRETLEETGLVVNRDRLFMLGIKEHFRYGSHYFMFYLWAPGVAGTPVNCEPDKCEGWKWHRLQEQNLLDNGCCTEPKDILQDLYFKTLE